MQNELMISLPSQHGWLDDPPNVDFLDIEFENEAKVDLRKQMIDGVTGNMEIESKTVTKDEVRFLCIHLFENESKLVNL